MTRISGSLDDGLGLADVVDSLHPTPAVCGTPRDLARRLIGEMEGFDRGLYAGALGWMDLDGNGEFDVAIRCGLINQCDALLFAGAGITAASDIDVELTETRNKFEPLLNAISQVPK
jgi:isochorismate synthase EntC